jgi:putative tryptophan/tyrosine transport system substrate-binding protein
VDRRVRLGAGSASAKRRYSAGARGRSWPSSASRLWRRARDCIWCARRRFLCLRSTSGPERATLPIDLLKEVVGLSKAALLVNAADPAAARYVELSNAAVGPLGVTVEPIEVRTPDDFGKAFSEISKRGLQGVATSQDGLIYNEQPQMFRLALQHRLPLIGYSREMAFNGALMTYGPNNATMFRRAGAFIDKILKGSKKIGDLPVEQPTKYELMINRKTAKAIGLDVSPVILSRADEVIE